MRIYRPSADREGIARGQRAIFLAGPIQGATDWQQTAIELLRKGEPKFDRHRFELDVFCPRSLGQVPEYYTQVAWERDHLEYAANNGVVLFWLANPAKLSWRDRLRVLTSGVPSRPHAQTSRLELGYELGRNHFGKAPGHVVVGMEPGFSNERFIRRMVEQEIGSHTITTSLSETVAAAVVRLCNTVDTGSAKVVAERYRAKEMSDLGVEAGSMEDGLDSILAARDARRQEP